MPFRGSLSKRGLLRASSLLFCLTVAFFLNSCGSQDVEDPELLRHTRLQLMDWHISGLGIINSPVAWVRIWNDNSVAIGDIVLSYATYDYEGHRLSDGTCPIPDAKVEPHQRHDYIELYLGLVDLHSEQLSVQIQSVGRVE